MKNEYSKIRLASSTYIMRLRKKVYHFRFIGYCHQFKLYFLTNNAHTQRLYTINGCKVHFCGTFGNIYFYCDGLHDLIYKMVKKLGTFVWDNLSKIDFRKAKLLFFEFIYFEFECILCWWKGQCRVGLLNKQILFSDKWCFG